MRDEQIIDEFIQAASKASIHMGLNGKYQLEKVMGLNPQDSKKIRDRMLDEKLIEYGKYGDSFFQLSELGRIVLNAGGYFEYSKQLLEIKKKETEREKYVFEKLKADYKLSKIWWLPLIISIFSFVIAVCALFKEPILHWFER